MDEQAYEGFAVEDGIAIVGFVHVAWHKATAVSVVERLLDGVPALPSAQDPEFTRGSSVLPMAYLSPWWVVGPGAEAWVRTA